VQCFTDGCLGHIKVAVELHVECGHELHRREMLRVHEDHKHRPSQAPLHDAKAERRYKGQAKAADAGMTLLMILLLSSPRLPIFRGQRLDDRWCFKLFDK
jgi:hypothetical protein